MEFFEKNYYFNEPLVSRGFSLADAGEEVCKPNHSFGGLRDNFVVHFVRSGKGNFTLDKRNFNPREGELFFIFPGIPNHYQADQHDPWHYKWVSFYGSDAAAMLNQAGISRDNPVIKVSNPEGVNKAFSNLFHMARKHNTFSHELKLTALLLSIISAGDIAPDISGWESPVPHTMRNSYYCEKIKRFISMNYQNPIGVSDITRFMALDRTYLSSLWKEETNTTLRDFLADYRVKRACYYLKSTDMSIKEIAFSVGYREYPVFERLFKRRIGKTPNQWRTA
jgi:AraC-like DNA-binding protein